MKAQVEVLMAAIGVVPLRRLCNTVLIVLMLCISIRKAEAARLEVADLRQRLSGELVLQVRKSNDRKEHLILYSSRLASCVETRKMICRACAAHLAGTVVSISEDSSEPSGSD